MESIICSDVLNEHYFVHFSAFIDPLMNLGMNYELVELISEAQVSICCASSNDVSTLEGVGP